MFGGWFVVFVLAGGVRFAALFRIPDQSPCPPSSTCINLEKCDPFMSLVKTSNNLPPPLSRFLKSRLCGFSNEQEPKVCCSDLPINFKQFLQSLNTTTTTIYTKKFEAIKALDESQCKHSYRCIDLMKCGPLVYLLDLDKPMAEIVKKLIRSQQCGFNQGYPKVCCRIFAKKLSVLEDLGGGESSTVSSLEEKSMALNSAFNHYYFVDSMAFDLLRRKREHKGEYEVDIEIR